MLTLLQVPPVFDGRFILLVIVVVFVWLLLFKSGGRGAHVTRTCRDCGALHPPFAKFCRRCGRKL